VVNAFAGFDIAEIKVTLFSGAKAIREGEASDGGFPAFSLYQPVMKGGVLGGEGSDKGGGETECGEVSIHQSDVND
jgi:hypothetical protein